MNKKYILKGLDCADCAAKLVDNINKLSFVKSAEINFPLKLLTVKYKANNKDIENKLIDLIKRLEPDIKINNTVEKEKFNPLNLIPLLGLMLFLLSYFPILPETLKYIFIFAGYLLISYKILFKAARKIFKLNMLDENVLMSVATLGAIAIGEYSEAVAVMIFYLIGESLQQAAVNRSKKSLKSLMDIKPVTARLVNGNEEIIVSPESIKIDDVIKVLPGEKIPLDGKVIAGSSSVDSSALTGEAVPKEIVIGDEVISGCINLSGVLLISVTKDFEISTVNKILQLIEDSGFRKSRSENFITKFAKVYTPVVVGLAALIALIPPIFVGNFNNWIYNALTFLVISCPCAIVLSVPLSYFCSIGKSAKKGILIKGSNYLEAISNVKTIVFDKTGTITTGNFKVTNIKPADGFTKEQLLKYAALAEKNSTHPLAKSICNEYKKIEQIDSHKLMDFEEKTAFGVVAKYSDKKILVGSSKMMTLHNIQTEKTDGNVVYVAINGRYVGYIQLEDEIKADAKDSIEKLKEQNINNIIMLTGDNIQVAEKVAKKTGILSVKASLLPNEKVEEIERLKNSSKVAFVGDGINDAPVIALSDVGIAMGSLGSDSAIEAADIVIMNDKLSNVNEIIKIARKTKKIVIQNIVFSLLIKFIIMALGFTSVASMWAAVFADVGVTLIAVLNSLRLLK